MDFIKQVAMTALRLSEEDVKNIVECTLVKEIYSCWESNDFGEDFALYTGFADDGVTHRYFLKHFERDWYGGWSYDDKFDWYEISEKDFLLLSQFDCKS